MSDTVSTGAKILRFPTPVEVEEPALTAPAAPRVSAPPAPPAATGGSAFQRLAAVRRRRGERTTDRPAAGEAADSPDAGAPGKRPSVSQLVTWLLNLRKGGVGFLYWNAAKLPIEVALVRAARLDDGAVVDVVGHRLLVVEPIRPLAPAGVTPTEGVLP